MRDLVRSAMSATPSPNARCPGTGPLSTKADVGWLFVDIVRVDVDGRVIRIRETAELSTFFTIVDEVVSRHNGMDQNEGEAALRCVRASSSTPIRRRRRWPCSVNRPGSCRETADPVGGDRGVLNHLRRQHRPERRYEYTVIGDPVNE